MRRILHAAAAALLTLAAAAPVHAQEAAVPIATGDWAPYTDSAAANLGAFSELVTASFKQAGMTTTIEFFPWKRAEGHAEDGKHYAVMPYIVTDERKQIFDFSDAVMVSTGRFFYNKKHFPEGITYEKLEDLKKHIIGVVRGYWFEKPFGEAGLEMDFTTSDSQNLGKLMKKRVALVPIDELVGWDLIRRELPNDAADFAVVAKPLNESQLHLMVSRKYPGAAQITERFNKGLAEIRANGQYREILGRYGLTVE